MYAALGGNSALCRSGSIIMAFNCLRSSGGREHLGCEAGAYIPTNNVGAYAPAAAKVKNN